ncbi:MAG: hypothetical protein ACPGXL_04000 [Chitinophagales bacterium]
MSFHLLPILDKIDQLYQISRNRKRFEQYLHLLQAGNKNDLKLPIGGFNPMANDHTHTKLKALINLGTEQIVQQTLGKLNEKWKNKHPNRSFQVTVNLIDDVGGAWSNHYTTDYKNRFDMGGLLSRNFCVPCFWMSEIYTKELVIQRTKAAVFRTLYWLEKGKPQTLKACFKQEQFVYRNLSTKGQQQTLGTKQQVFYKQYQDSDNYNLIFNFFYGDEVAKTLGYPSFGLGNGQIFELI